LKKYTNLETDKCGSCNKTLTSRVPVNSGWTKNLPQFETPWPNITSKFASLPYL